MHLLINTLLTSTLTWYTVSAGAIPDRRTIPGLQGGYINQCENHGQISVYPATDDSNNPAMTTEIGAYCAAPGANMASYSSYTWTGINLNKCLTNINGQLLWRSGYVLSVFFVDIG
jgi:hypothetical protein